MSADCWKVYYVRDCRHTTPPKPKYVVTFKHNNGLYLGLLINSNMTDYARRNSHISPCIVKISADLNGFLDYDSYVSCQEAYEFSPDELIQFEGYVAEESQEKIRTAIVACPVMKYKWKRSILQRIDGEF